MEKTTSAKRNQEKEVLEVEDEDERSRRLYATLAKLNEPSSSRHPMQHGPTNPLTRPNIEPLPPSSEVLARAQAFLPQMKAQNDLLVQKNPDDLNIEHIEDVAAPYIEMDLGLGVYTMRRQGDQDDSEEGSSDTDVDSTSNEDSTSDESDSPASRPIRPLPRRAQNMIQVLNEQGLPSSSETGSSS
ncbi:hypothetical protein FISHEDRAFT_72177 [Fistulina hepatica ATCC 64428]|uniref:Uncharacterized protein n=1 Tax=Fistulina hepatica ATCC 64428 TaxID=1128425 RepID=A0A0D7AGH9_9AGAR|nr:hypothetical protein FISHEDRAFT_72177 [Fistulina hepatica ATCC 64428]